MPMTGTSLREFVEQVSDAGRIRFGDLRRLQRDLLPSRITSCEEAELLISLDRAVRKFDRDWNDYFVSAVRDFVVWGMEPIGQVDRGKAEWLLRVLSHGGITRRGRTIARHVVQDALEVDALLMAFVGGASNHSVHAVMTEPTLVLQPAPVPMLQAA
jgi:hypothetical protein